MRRAPIVACTVLLAAVAGGCGSGTVRVPASIKAPPQTALLDWTEPFPADAPALVFGVSSFTVTPSGWTADVSVENRSRVGWDIGGPDLAAARSFGVLLFPDDDLEEMERRNHSNDLPGIRPALTFDPALPLVLAPGTTWRATIGAPGALAGGRWVRLSFGTFKSVGDPPEGTGPLVGWFTDHAYRLTDQEGEPS